MAIDLIMFKRQLKSSVNFKSQTEFNSFYRVGSFKPFESVAFEYEFPLSDNGQTVNEFLRISKDKITSLEVVEFFVLASEPEVNFYEQLPNLKRFKADYLSFWRLPFETFHVNSRVRGCKSPGFLTLFPKLLTNLSSLHFNKTRHPFLPFLFLRKSNTCIKRLHFGNLTQDCGDAGAHALQSMLSNLAATYNERKPCQDQLYLDCQAIGNLPDELNIDDLCQAILRHKIMLSGIDASWFKKFLNTKTR